MPRTFITEIPEPQNGTPVVKRGKWVPLMRACVRNPGLWTKWNRAKSSSFGLSTLSYAKDSPSYKTVREYLPDFEVTTRVQPDGLVDVWVRYNPPADEVEEAPLMTETAWEIYKRMYIGNEDPNA